MAAQPSHDMKKAHHTATTEDIGRARALRRAMPKAERLLWNRLRESETTVRCQHPLHPYIVDFACVKARLAIELDGESHDTRQTYDQNRDRVLSEHGYKTLRFTNDDVLTNIDSVLETILHEAGKRSPPPLGGGLGGGSCPVGAEPATTSPSGNHPPPSLPPRGEGLGGENSGSGKTL